MPRYEVFPRIWRAVGPHWILHAESATTLGSDEVVGVAEMVGRVQEEDGPEDEDWDWGVGGVEEVHDVDWGEEGVTEKANQNSGVAIFGARWWRFCQAGLTKLDLKIKLRD